ncbi:hypothetical protein [Plebeiibacterium sediminum]|uniref:Uncharacterized protein n=1 Tax=Plebeiibacterium sediminum TaxID=2992112 RepID=A0AAE3M5H9_9BACT|nr:hypothetical protein [Plebeiobacterium sediminum]MCW3787326.1 hypothetical protein [Plebeiobacterium sediminum]
MKPIAFFTIFFLSLMHSTCNPEQKEIRGTWTIDDKSSSTLFIFDKNGSYTNLVYDKVYTNNKEDMVFQNGSLGYYKYADTHKYDLYPFDVDISPILGKSVTDATIGLYLNNCMKNHSKPDLDHITPTFIAQIKKDGEQLQIIQNNKLIIELNKRHIKFGDKR